MKKSNSIDEYIEIFTKNFNKNVPSKITDLWNVILEYGDIMLKLGNEGNSGEFHSEKDAKRLKDEQISMDVVIKFAKLTGYRPVFIKNKKRIILTNNNNKEINYVGAYDFIKINN